MYNEYIIASVVWKKCILQFCLLHKLSIENCVELNQWTYNLLLCSLGKMSCNLEIIYLCNLVQMCTYRHYCTEWTGKTATSDKADFFRHVNKLAFINLHMNGLNFVDFCSWCLCYSVNAICCYVAWFLLNLSERREWERVVLNLYRVLFY